MAKNRCERDLCETCVLCFFGTYRCAFFFFRLMQDYLWPRTDALLSCGNKLAFVLVTLFRAVSVPLLL